MEIILLERVEKLGKVGDKINVKPGYARNYLLPRKKALRATKENIAYYETKKAQIEADNAKMMEDAVAMAKTMEGLTVSLIRQAAETGQLYGSVTGRDIRDAIAGEGFIVERKQIDLQVAIKNVGSYNIAVKLHPDVSQIVKVNIGRSLDEAQKLGTAAQKAETELIAIGEEKEAKEETVGAEKKPARKASKKAATEETVEE